MNDKRGSARLLSDYTSDKKSYGGSEGKSVGDGEVNLAARLQAQCEPDRILLSHSTWVLVKDVIACVSKGDIQVRGFREPVSVYGVSEPGESV